MENFDIRLLAPPAQPNFLAAQERCFRSFGDKAKIEEVMRAQRELANGDDRKTAQYEHEREDKSKSDWLSRHDAYLERLDPNSWNYLDVLKAKYLTAKAAGSPDAESLRSQIERHVLFRWQRPAVLADLRLEELAPNKVLSPDNYKMYLQELKELFAMEREYGFAAELETFETKSFASAQMVNGWVELGRLMLEQARRESLPVSLLGWRLRPFMMNFYRSKGSNFRGVTQIQKYFWDKDPRTYGRHDVLSAIRALMIVTAREILCKAPASQDCIEAKRMAKGNTWTKQVERWIQLAGTQKKP